MFIADVPGMIIWLISTLVKIAVIILIAVLIIKGIKYLRRKEDGTHNGTTAALKIPLMKLNGN